MMNFFEMVSLKIQTNIYKMCHEIIRINAASDTLADQFKFELFMRYV